MRRLAVLTAMMLSAAANAGPQPLQGLWIHRDEWQYAPQELNEDGDIHKAANAAVLNFCRKGVFRMATGVIYQSSKSPSVQIGVSDGLAIYLGTWAETPDGITVRYQLIDAEFHNLIDDPVASAPHTAQPTWEGGRLVFPFTNSAGKVFPLPLTSAARYEKSVIDKWVECERKAIPPPPKPRRAGGDPG
jgi:hypothetical protein